ncbi:MAG: GIY-YIG nuclease family protein [Bacteroidia bacterium]|nr:GIY-YIG nuclease family protein [Bacteroidia bacterium]
MKYFFVYIVECSDNSYYTGLTSDIEQRIGYHNSSESKGLYTSNRQPVKLLWSVQLTDFTEAEHFEKQIKGWSRKKKEALMSENWDRLKILAVCQNDTRYIHDKKV